MPSADETQQMIDDEIAPITAQLDQLDYELDSRIDSLQTQVDGRIDVVADHVTQLDGSLEDRFISQAQLRTLEDRLYWRDQKVDAALIKVDAALADSKAKAVTRLGKTSRTVDLLTDHIGALWDYTAGLYDELQTNYNTSSEVEAIVLQQEMMQSAKAAGTSAKLRDVAKLSLRLCDRFHSLQGQVESLKYDTDVDHIVSTSIIHSVNKLEAAHTTAPRSKRTRTVVTDCRPRRSQRLKPKNLAPAMDSVSEMTQICHDNETSV